MKNKNNLMFEYTFWVLGLGLFASVSAQAQDDGQPKQSPLVVCPGTFNPNAIIARGSTMDGSSAIGFVKPLPQSQGTPRVNAQGIHQSSSAAPRIATQVATAVKEVVDLQASGVSSNGQAHTDVMQFAAKAPPKAQVNGGMLTPHTEPGASQVEEIAAFLNQNVKGQPEAVEMAARFLASFEYGLTDPNRPAGIFVNAGVTGTGKTELVKSIAVYLTARGLRMKPEDAMIAYSGAELKEQAGVAKILGAPAGYVGADAGSRLNKDLVDRIKANIGTMLLLFDEIEKAHKEIWDVILTVADDGLLTVSKVKSSAQAASVVMMNADGSLAAPKANVDTTQLPDLDGDKDQTIQKTNLRGSFIFLTMNVGQKEIHSTIDNWRLQQSQGGPSMYLKSGDFHPDFLDQVEKECRSAVEKYFRENLGRPEIFERLDSVLWFRPGNRTIAFEIMLNEIAKFQIQLLSPNGDKSPHLLFSLSDDAEKFLFQQLGDIEKYGYRMVRRSVQQNLQPLFLEILSRTRVTDANGTRRVRTGDLIHIDVAPGTSQRGAPINKLVVRGVEVLNLPKQSIDGSPSVGDLAFIADQMMKDSRFQFNPHIVDRLDALWTLQEGYGIAGTISPAVRNAYRP